MLETEKKTTMRLILFDDMSQCTDAEVERLLPLVSAPRREVALRFKFTFGRFTCLKSYVMLQQLVQETLAETDERWLPLQQRLKEWNGNFVYNEHDKPFMQNVLGERIEGVDFNLSHCKNAIAVVLSDRPVGVDVESFRHAEEPLLKRTMNPEEQEEVRTAADPTEAFTRLWTRKEAVLKLHGTGLVDNLHEVLTNLENIQLETTINKNRQYACTLAVYKT
jgi:4'-phosphopantetheinyl transferase